MESEPKIKQKIQSLIFGCSIILLVGKFIAYLLTGSAAIFTDAMESIVNVAAGGISLYCIRLASRPRDDSHPFGHGKIEMISASMEGILIIMAGAIIIYHGFERLFTPSPPQPPRYRYLYHGSSRYSQLLSGHAQYQNGT